MKRPTKWKGFFSTHDLREWLKAYSSKNKPYCASMLRAMGFEDNGSLSTKINSVSKDSDMHIVYVEKAIMNRKGLDSVNRVQRIKHIYFDDSNEGDSL
jgi:hypothetical protein